MSKSFCLSLFVSFSYLLINYLLIYLDTLDFVSISITHTQVWKVWCRGEALISKGRNGKVLFCRKMAFLYVAFLGIRAWGINNSALDLPNHGGVQRGTGGALTACWYMDHAEKVIRPEETFIQTAFKINILVWQNVTTKIQRKSADRESFITQQKLLSVPPKIRWRLVQFHQSQTTEEE